MPKMLREEAQAFLDGFPQPLSEKARSAIELVYLCGAANVVLMLKNLDTIPEREDMLEELFREVAKEYEDAKSKVMVIDDGEEE